MATSVWPASNQPWGPNCAGAGSASACPAFSGGDCGALWGGIIEPGQRGFPVLESPPGKVGPACLRVRGAVIARGSMATAAGTEEIQSKEYGARHNGECGWGPWAACVGP